MSVTVKCFLELPDESHEIRRFPVDEGAISSYVYLKDAILQAFGTLADKAIKTYWIDPEGDKVTFSTDNELMEALSFRAGDVLKVYVQVCGQAKHRHHQEHSGGLHFGVRCDGCEGPVCGFRYKCRTCPDYDLCEKCKEKGLHPEHEFEKMERSGGRRCGGRRGFRPGGRGGSCGRYRFPGSGMGSGHPWAHYLDPQAAPEFLRNMFGPCQGQARGGEGQSSGGQGQTSDSQGQTQGQGHTSGHTGGFPNMPHSKEQANEFLQHVGEQVAAFLDPVGIDVQVSVDPHTFTPGSGPEEGERTPTASTTASGQSASGQAIPGETASGEEARAEAPGGGNRGEDGDRGSGDEWVTLGDATNSSMDTSDLSHSANPDRPHSHEEAGASAPPPGDDLNAAERALNQLMSMGFHDNEGWLTRVVLRNDGDMQKVMDEILKSRAQQ